MTRDAILSGYGLPLKGQLLKRLGGDIDIDLVLQDFISYQLELLEDSVSLFPQVMSTLETLKEMGKKLAIVTSRKSTSMKRILKATDTAQFFDTIVTPEDTTRHKPDAAPVLLAISRLNAHKSATVFTGDSKYDILSGSSAGIDTVFVNWSHMDSAALPVKPTWIIDSLQDLIDRQLS